MPSHYDNPHGPTVAPLRPYQRPILILFFLLVAMVAVIPVSVILYAGTTWFKFFKYSDHQPDEVTFDTNDTAETANELLLQYSQRLLQFDQHSRTIFGLKHQWLVDGERAETPESVYRMVQAHGDSSLLRDYFDLGNRRVELERTLTELEVEVDATVSTIPPDATKERVFQAERLVRKRILFALDELDLSCQILDTLEQNFKETSHEEHHQNSDHLPHDLDDHLNETIRIVCSDR